MFHVCLFFLFFSSVDCELRLVLAIWRHGDRAPSSLPYPNDPYNETSWPRGWNQLTNVGIEQTFELGQWMRQRYIDGATPLLKKDFDKDDVFIRSSDSERAIESGLSVTAGLFPASGSLMWNLAGLKTWQPIPIHTNGDGRDDPLLKPTSIDCPAYTERMKQENTDLEKKVNSDYSDLFVRLANYTGMESVNFTNVKHLYDITREIANDMAPPTWINEQWNGTKIIDHINELKRITRTHEFDSVEKAKYRGGYLINDWLDKMEAVKNGTSERKAVLYSSHDGTLSALTYAMGVSDNQLIPYAATVIAELHQNDTEYSVKLFYKKDSTTAMPLTLPNCTDPCPLDRFQELLEPVRIRDDAQLNQLCTLGSSSTMLITASSILFMLASYIL